MAAHRTMFGLAAAAGIISIIPTTAWAQQSHDNPSAKDGDYSVALIGDQNYGCDLNVKSLTGFVQGVTAPKCSGALADDLPAPVLPLGVPGRSKSNEMIRGINASGVAFTIHDGDTKSGSTECRSSIVSATLAQFNGLPDTATNPGFDKPIVYTPGDNEWTDCHRFAFGKVPDADLPAIPIAKLDEIRKTFFTAPRSQGRTTMPLTTQTGYPENARWQQGSVVYVTINQPGSNNNVCSPNQNTTVCNEGGEATMRNAANMTWLKNAFRDAHEHDAEAVVITAQGNPNFEANAATDLPTYDLNGYNEFLTTVRDLTKRFEGQVVYVHGDSHAMTFDHPLTDAVDLRDPAQVRNAKPIANFTRIETSGKEDSHWVKMTVHDDGPLLLTFEPMIVAVNLGNNPDHLPWNVTALPAKLNLPRIDN